MDTLTHDLKFLQSITNPFFSQKHIKKTLVAIEEDSISGWEKWLQIEFASFLREHTAVKSWGRESQYKLDKRVAKAAHSCSVDFIIHQKHKQSHIALELKQINSPSRCISAMIKDIKRLNEIRRSEFDIRSVWCLGVHYLASTDDVKREALYYASKLGVEIKAGLVASRKIGRSGYCYTLI